MSTPLLANAQQLSVCVCVENMDGTTECVYDDQVGGKTREMAANVPQDKAKECQKGIRDTKTKGLLPTRIKKRTKENKVARAVLLAGRDRKCREERRVRPNDRHECWAQVDPKLATTTTTTPSPRLISSGQTGWW